MNKYTESKDKTLVELTLTGDDSAFAELVVRHERRVLGSAMKVTRNKWSAQDASQDAFVRAWMKLDELREPEKFGSWVAQIASNRARDIVTHYSSACAYVSFELIEGTLAEPTSDDTADRLHDELDALSATLRETIWLHYFGGYSVAEIAAKLKIPIGTVKWRLSEGRKQLRKGYGIMDENYNENEKLVERVMRQVEQLKLMMLRNSREGFEDFYRLTLEGVESLPESQMKQHALADVLRLGAWWIAGEKNDALFERIKSAAIAGHNDEVMQTVAVHEYEKYSGDEREKFMREVLIPEYETLGFPKTVGYVRFWLGHHYFCSEKNELARKMWQKCAQGLECGDVYYATALSALHLLDDIENRQGDGNFNYHADGETWRCIDGKLYFWTQPGFSGGIYDRLNDSLIYNASRCDSLILDPTMKVGEKIVSSDGKVTLTCDARGFSLETPAGRFDDCVSYTIESDDERNEYARTVFAPGVGIIAQTSVKYKSRREWVLKKYRVKGSGLMPLEVGNRWEYDCLTPPPGTVYAIDRFLEITDSSGGKTTVGSCLFAEHVGFTDDWYGHIAAMRRGYVKHEGDMSRLVDVSEHIKRAEELASSKRERVHTAIAADVMRRIFATDVDFTPDCTERGMWNFFNKYVISASSGEVRIADHDRSFSFEWKEHWRDDLEGNKVLYGFIFDILNDGTGFLWSEDWKPGFETEFEERGVKNRITVEKCESVTTPGGVFFDCLKLTLVRIGLNGRISYRGGEFEYYFAHGVGIVAMSRPLDGGLENIWWLTEYRGSGDGYFPLGDRFFRRYEPKSIGNGWCASVEYTYDEDEHGLVIFRNALGNKKR